MRVGKMQKFTFYIKLRFFFNFFFKYTSEALFKVYFNSKIVGLMGWHSVVFCCQIAVRQSDHMIQTHTINPCN